MQERIATEVTRQEKRWGDFERSRESIRLGLACIEDEVREAFQAFEEDRHDDFCGLGWSGTIGELVQVAALATRLATDLARP
jgi:hypothetical protein